MLSTLLFTMFISFMPISNETLTNSATSEATEINWVTLDEAVEKSKKNDKIVMIDFYTDWCGWCKKLDANTYMNPEVVKYVNENFYAVKFNAEQKEDLVFNGKTYSTKSNGSRGTNDFAIAYASRSGRLGYPTISFISTKGDKLGVEAGYKDPNDMMLMLKFYAEGTYKTMDFTSYKNKAAQEIKAE